MLQLEFGEPGQFEQAFIVTLSTLVEYYCCKQCLLAPVKFGL